MSVKEQDKQLENTIQQEEPQETKQEQEAKHEQEENEQQKTAHTSNVENNEPIHIVQDQTDAPPSTTIPTGIFESTLDSLATIGSKINPLTHRIGKGLGQVRQYAQEKFGTAEDITELPQEYKDLEKRVDQLEHLYHQLVKVTKVYATPNYDYPLGFTNTVTNQIALLAHEHNSSAQTPEHPKSLSHAMGRVASQSASELGKDEALRAALSRFASAANKVGNAKLTMDHEVVARFHTPLQTCLKTSIEGANKARRVVHQKRLALDAAKTEYRETPANKLDMARSEVEQAEDQFVGAVEEATHLMKTVLEDPEPYRDLAEYVQVQLAYFREAHEILNKLLPELQEIQKTQETVYRALMDDE